MENENINGVAQPDESLVLETQEIVNIESENAQSGEVESSEGNEAQSQKDDAKHNEDNIRKKRSAAQRISELTWQKRSAENRLQALEAHNAELLQRLHFYNAPIDNGQVPIDYNQDYGAYEPQINAYVPPYVNPDEIRQQVRQEITQEQSQNALIQKANAFVEKLQDEAAIDFLYNPDLPPAPPELVEMVFDSPLGSDMVSYFANNQAEYSRIVSLPLHRSALELARIEAKLQIKPTPKTTSAPAPAPIVSSSGAGQAKDISNDIDALYAAYISPRT